MIYRGPTLIVFGLSLILSPFAIALATADSETTPPAPGQVATVGGQDAACSAKSVDTPIGRMGCNARVTRTETRRIAQNGALFVSARN